MKYNMKTWLIERLNLLKRIMINVYKTRAEYKIEYVYEMIFVVTEILSISALWLLLAKGNIITEEMSITLIALSIILKLVDSIISLLVIYPPWYAEAGRERLTYMLTKPNLCLHIFSEGVSLSSVSEITISIIAFILIYPFIPNPNIIMFSLFFVIAVFVYAFFNLLGLALSFWYDKIGEAWHDMFWPIIFEAPKYPLWKMGGSARFVLSFMVPVMYIAAYPMLAMKGAVGWDVLIYGLILVLFLYFVLYILFRRGLRRFESVGG